VSGIAGDLAAGEFTDRRFRKFGPSSTIVTGVFRGDIFPDLRAKLMMLATANWQEASSRSRSTCPRNAHNTIAVL